MLGLLFMSLFKWIDLDMVYVNPTYLTSAIVGGVVMGAGFIMGGFCPGTSVCAASIGKLDGLMFIGGLVIGILIFTEGYPWWEKLYMADFKGFPKISEALNLSDGVTALGVILAAVGMFYVGEWAEKKFPREEY